MLIVYRNDVKFMGFIINKILIVLDVFVNDLEVLFKILFG